MWVALVAFVLPLGLDTFAVAAAVGASRPSGRVRWRISALFVVFEAGMPLLGVALGAPLAHRAGSAADYLAAALLIAVGGWLLFGPDDDEGAAAKLTGARGLAVLGLGVSISIDELAVGFTLGLTRLPIPAVIAAIALQALLATQLGLSLGARIGHRSREWAERLAGLALAGLGLSLLIAALNGHQLG